MATNDMYTRFKTTANKLLAKVGVKSTIETAAGDELEGFSLFMKTEDKDSSGVATQSDTRTVYFQGDNDLEPGAGDYLRFKDQVWSIVSVEPYNPDGETVIIFKLQVAQ